MTAADILDADAFAAHVGGQALAFSDGGIELAVKAALDEAEVLAGVRASAMETAPDWLAAPVARIALFVLSQTAEGWDRDQLDACA